jgi:hypothetical protein
MGITWSGELPLNLKRLDPYVMKRMAVSAHAFAPRAEKHIKETAPWTDRTSNARNSLTARPEIRNGGEEAVVILAHGVFYGIFLEVRFSGAYAVIIPSIEVLAPQYMKLAARLIFVDNTLGGGSVA